MAFTVERLSCPCCGFEVSVGMKECPAGHPLNISTFNSVRSMPFPLVNNYIKTFDKDLQSNPDDKAINYSIGICYLKLGIYDKALSAFEKAMEENFDNSEAFFYAAICLLQGKKAFLHQRPTIDKISEYINAALMIEPKGIYYYFLAYIKYDYFERKFFKTSPTYREALASAEQSGYSPLDVEELFSVLGVDVPAVF